MAQSKKKINYQLIYAFSIALFSSIFLNCFINVKFIYFAPFLLLAFYKKSFISVLWLSGLCGLICDFFSSNALGIFALNYLLASLFLFRERRFFNDKPINLSIFTTIYAFIFSLFNPILFFMFDKNLNLSIKWVATDLLIMPLLDGIYAFLFFAVPLLLIEQIKKINFKNLWTTYKKIIFQK